MPTSLVTEGEFVLVDPACRMREGMEQLAEAVDRHRGELIAILFTHSHGDHIGDMDLLREAFDVPVWGSEYTSRSVHCDRILVDGEVLQLGKPRLDRTDYTRPSPWPCLSPL